MIVAHIYPQNASYHRRKFCIETMKISVGSIDSPIPTLRTCWGGQHVLNVNICRMDEIRSMTSTMRETGNAFIASAVMARERETQDVLTILCRRWSTYCVAAVILGDALIPATATETNAEEMTKITIVPAATIADVSYWIDEAGVNTLFVQILNILFNLPSTDQCPTYIAVLQYLCDQWIHDGNGVFPPLQYC